ncbi:MAG: universal stress protein [bacterium]|nr:universal stress protein [bacterium]
MGLKIAKILFPTDFSEVSLVALKYARELAVCFDAQLHCVHVVDEAYQYWTSMGPETTPLGPAVEDVASMAEAQMDRFADQYLVGMKYAPVTKVLLGRPYKEIVAYALEAMIDIIVLATHGRGGLAQVLLGSTADKVIHNAPCPVLSVRATEHDAESQRPA